MRRPAISTITPYPQQHRQQIKWLTRHLLVDALNKMKICSIKKRKTRDDTAHNDPNQNTSDNMGHNRTRGKTKFIFKASSFQTFLTPSNSYPIHYTLFHWLLNTWKDKKTKLAPLALFLFSHYSAVKAAISDVVIWFVEVWQEEQVSQG